MDYSLIRSCGIRNLAPVFGRGLRGETFAASRNRQWVDAVLEMGVRRLIDLRTADHNDKLMAECQRRGIEYHHFPVDSCVQEPQLLAQSLPELFHLLDEDGFYISCQQGLHRTDIALALYYFFHDSKKIPVILGHIRKGALRCDDIMRRINAMRPYFSDITEEDFQSRRRRFLDSNREKAEFAAAIQNVKGTEDIKNCILVQGGSRHETWYDENGEFNESEPYFAFCLINGIGDTASCYLCEEMPEDFEYGEIRTGSLVYEDICKCHLVSSVETHLPQNSSDGSVLRIHREDGKLLGLVDGFPQQIVLTIKDQDPEVTAFLQTLQENDLVWIYGWLTFCEKESDE